MFISIVDTGLERMLRAALPLPEEIGDVTFDAPTNNWSAQLSRVTVNLFLYDIGRSTQPSRSPVTRLAADGRSERRRPQPMVELGYLVSAWAGSPRDEHQLLGDVASVLAVRETLPAELLPAPLSSVAQLSFDADPHNRTREIWSSLGGQLKASFLLRVAVAADSYEWADEAPAVQRIAALTAPMPGSGGFTR